MSKRHLYDASAQAPDRHPKHDVCAGDVPSPLAGIQVPRVSTWFFFDNNNNFLKLINDDNNNTNSNF